MDVKGNTSELGKSFKRLSIWSHRGGIAGRGELGEGEGWSSCRSLVWQSGPVLVEMRGWAESPRSHLDLSPHGFWSLLGTAWALLSYPGAVGDCRWQRFGEIGFVWKQISLSLLQIIYVYFWRGKSNQAAKNSIAMTSWWCLAYSRRLPCV